MAESFYYYDNESESLLKFDSLTKKTITIVSGPLSFEIHGDYVTYSLWKTVTEIYYGREKTTSFYAPTTFYHHKTGEVTECDIDSDLFTIVGDTAIYVEYSREDGVKYDEMRLFRLHDQFSIIAFDIKTQKVKQSKPISTTTGLRYGDTYNGKAYFFSDYDLYSYDIEKNKFTKLKRPSDVIMSDSIDEQCIYNLEIIKHNDKAYLKWYIFALSEDGNSASDIIKMRQIS